MASPNVTYEEVVAGGPDAIVRADRAPRGPGPGSASA